MQLSNYIGIPFEPHGRTFGQADCWGVVWLWYYYKRGVQLPQLLTYSDDKDSDSISELVESERPQWKQVNDPQEGDVVVIRIAGKETHVGIYLEGNRMIHAHRGTDSCVESLKTPRWAKRIAGFYRYEK